MLQCCNVYVTSAELLPNHVMRLSVLTLIVNIILTNSYNALAAATHTPLVAIGSEPNLVFSYQFTSFLSLIYNTPYSIPWQPLHSQPRDWLISIPANTTLELYTETESDLLFLRHHGFLPHYPPSVVWCFGRVLVN